MGLGPARPRPLHLLLPLQVVNAVAWQPGRVRQFTLQETPLLTVARSGLRTGGLKETFLVAVPEHGPIAVRVQLLLPNLPPLSHMRQRPSRLWRALRNIHDFLCFNDG